MTKIGIIGGIGPESSIEYYRKIIQGYRQRLNSKDYPEFLIHSINMTEMLAYVNAGQLEELTAFLKNKIQVLKAAGAESVVLASNTPHLVFDQLKKTVDVSMISIVEAACQEIAASGLKKVGLLGTKSTMSKGFYQEKAQELKIEMFIPNVEDQAYVHQKYMGELVFKQILPETKQGLFKIIHKLKVAHDIEGIVLGGTELPLILQQKDFTDLKVFDTTEIHVDAILNRMIN